MIHVVTLKQYFFRLFTHTCKSIKKKLRRLAGPNSAVPFNHQQSTAITINTETACFNHLPPDQLD